MHLPKLKTFTHIYGFHAELIVDGSVMYFWIETIVFECVCVVFYYQTWVLCTSSVEPSDRE